MELTPLIVLALVAACHGQKGLKNSTQYLCPSGNAVLNCFANPCDVLTCPLYPDAICINDNPCQPACDGSFYIEGRSRLSMDECYGLGPGNFSLPEWCPPRSPMIRCLAPPCQGLRCPAYPKAKCLADNPCEPSCSGSFYQDRRRLSRSECRKKRKTKSKSNKKSKSKKKRQPPIVDVPSKNTTSKGKGSSIPKWCPRGSPILHCIANHCDVETCPSFPDAICINDNPCERACDGSFYIEGRPRLSREECHGQGQGDSGIPEWCRPRSPRLRCTASPCQVMKCPAYPKAKCLANNRCEPICSGKFYLGNQPTRPLTRSECRRRRKDTGRY